MKKAIIAATAASGIMILTGCAQPAPAKVHVVTEKECDVLQKKLIQTDTFINELTAMDAAHVEEALAAVPRTEITTSTYKPRALKDAKKRKAELQAEFAKSGCESEK